MPSSISTYHICSITIEQKARCRNSSDLGNWQKNSQISHQEKKCSQNPPKSNIPSNPHSIHARRTFWGTLLLIIHCKRNASRMKNSSKSIQSTLKSEKWYTVYVTQTTSIVRARAIPHAMRTSTCLFGIVVSCVFVSLLR